MSPGRRGGPCVMPVRATGQNGLRGRQPRARMQFCPSVPLLPMIDAYTDLGGSKCVDRSAREIPWERWHLPETLIPSVWGNVLL